MPTFDNVNIFGTAVTMSTVDLPRESQLNSYFGLSGMEVLDGGARGRMTTVTGLLYGDSAAHLAAAEALFRSYNDGGARILVDDFGSPWANVRLESFQPWGRVRQSSNGNFYRPYRARFLHLA